MAAAAALFILTIATVPVFVREGVAVGLGMMALSAVAPLVVLVIIVCAWSVNDRKAAARAGTRTPSRAADDRP